MRSSVSDIFSGKFSAGYSFHGLVMQAHARTAADTTPDVEKMRDKVRWHLQRVSLYLMMWSHDTFFWLYPAVETTGTPPGPATGGQGLLP